MNWTKTQVDIEHEQVAKKTAAPSELKAQTERQTWEKKEASENGAQSHELNEELAAFSDAQVYKEPDMELASVKISEERTTKTGVCHEVQADFQETFETNVTRSGIEVKLQDGTEFKTKLMMSKESLVSALKG